MVSDFIDLLKIWTVPTSLSQVRVLPESSSFYRDALEREFQSTLVTQALHPCRQLSLHVVPVCSTSQDIGFMFLCCEKFTLDKVAADFLHSFDRIG